MNNAVLSSGLKALGYGGNNLNRLSRWHWTIFFEHRLYSAAIDVLHHKEMDIVISTRVVNPNDIRVANFRGGACFLEKPINECLVFADKMSSQCLDCHRNI